MKRILISLGVCGVLAVLVSSAQDDPVEQELALLRKMASHVEAFHELPGYARFLETLGSFARLISFDKRGTGLSDRDTGAPSYEQRMDDLTAVMDAAGSTCA